MIIGILLGGLVGLFSRSVIVGIISFYLITGLHKSRLWLAIPLGRRNAYLPPIIKEMKLKSFILGIFLWPLIVKNGDPLKEYFLQVEKGNEKLP